MSAPTDGGDVNPAVAGINYPAAKGWWMAGNRKWYPPPEPAEPPGTVHAVGERKPTWNGISEWNGSAWVLLPEFGGDLVAPGVHDSFARGDLYGVMPGLSDPARRDVDTTRYQAPPKWINWEVIRTINYVAVGVGIVALAFSLVLYVLFYTGSLSPAGQGLIVLSFLALFPVVFWMFFLMRCNGVLPRRGSRIPVSAAFALMPSGAKLPVICVIVVALVPALASFGIHRFGASSVGFAPAPPSLKLFLAAAIFNQALSLAVAWGEMQRRAEAASDS